MNRNGVSTIVLIIGVALIIALVIFGSGVFKEELNKEIEEDVKTQMLKVEAKAKIIIEKFHVDKNNGLHGTEMAKDDIDEKFNVAETEKYYKWEQQTLNDVGLSDIRLKEGQYYLVNYDTEEIIYSEGLKTKAGETYYKLSEIKKLQDQNTESNEEGETNEGQGDSQAQQP